MASTKSFKLLFAPGTSCVWGIPFKSNKGTIQSYTESSTADKQEVKDEGGTVVAVSYYNPRREVSFTLVAKSNVTAPEYGEKFETKAEDGTALIGTFEQVEVGYGNEQFKTYNISALIYEKVTPTGTEAWEDVPNVTIGSGV